MLIMHSFSTFQLCLCLFILISHGASPALANRHRHHRTAHHRGSANQEAPRQHIETCAEPSDLRQRLNELYSQQVQGHLHDTFYMLPLLSQVAENQTARYNFLPKSVNRTQAFGGSPVCPPEEQAEFFGDPCPTYSVINTDFNRYPRLLLEKRCRNCVRCRGITTTTHRDADVIPSCEGVFHYVRALRRTGCVNGVHRYESTWEKIQIGCACKLVVAW